MIVVRPFIKRLSACWIKLSVSTSTAEVASSQDKDWRILEDGACNGEALLLTAGELDASLADMRVVSVRQCFDEFVGVCDAGGFDRFLPALSGIAIEDIFEDGPIKEESVLQHHADVGAQRVQGDVSHVDSVDKHPASGGIVKWGIRPAMVLLPTPVGPTNASDSPGRTEKETSLSTGTPST